MYPVQYPSKAAVVSPEMSKVRACIFRRKCPSGAALITGSSSQRSDLPRAGQSGYWILVEARFSASVHTNPGVHPDSCTMPTGSFQREKRGCSINHPSPSSAKVKERVEYISTPPPTFMAGYGVKSNNNVMEYDIRNCKHLTPKFLWALLMLFCWYTPIFLTWRS